MGPSATYYEILKVSSRAEAASVRAAYRRLAQKYHPDKLPGNADAVRVMAMLNEAYGVLSDPDRRAGYDRRIEDERECALRALRRGLPAIEAPTAAWPWYLLFATIAFALAAISTVAYKTMVPGAAIAVSAAAVKNAQRAPLSVPPQPKSD